MQFPEKNIINDWLEKNGNPEIEKLVEKNMAIANKIHSVLQNRGLKPADLARMLDKKPSEISKWLTGNHTFTTKTIAKIETVLGEDIIHVEPQKEYIYFKVMIPNGLSAEDMAFENSEVFTTGVNNPKKAS